MGISVGGPSNTEINTQLKQDELKNQPKPQDVQDQMTRQSGQSADPSTMAALAAQLQQQALQQQQQNTAQGTSYTPEVTAKANAIATTVVAELMRQIMGKAPDTSGAGAGDESSAESSASGFGTSSAADTGGGITSSSGSSESQNNSSSDGGLGHSGGHMTGDPDQDIQDAAKVSCYSQIATMLQGMQNTRNTKTNVENGISAINQKIANAKPGDQVNVPTYDDNGNFTGAKQMTYEDATAMRDHLSDVKDSMGDVSQMQMFQLQQLMDQKGQLESMISNCMKAFSDTQQGLAGNLKAS